MTRRAPPAGPTGEPQTGKTLGRCPICGAPRRHEWRPFCSPRCRDRDLGRWLDGSYAVPAVESADDEGTGEDPTER
ncbi:MAG: DNA gyrase inhibitor YacG [Geminicoccaceae bacterium]|nr:DNA gyrase inhibitor YacG [Geminicoccaceae bacterium]